MTATTTTKPRTRKTAAAKTGPAKPAAKTQAPSRQTALAAAAAARLAAVPEDRRKAITGFLPAGYTVIWPKVSWSTLKLNGKAEDGAAQWMIMCNAHGTTKAIPTSTAAVAEGRRDQMQVWCPACKRDAAKAAKKA